MTDGSSSMRPLARWSFLAVLCGVVILVAGFLLIPADRTLGGTTRLVFVHGAITWTGILLTLAAAGVSVWLLLSGSGVDRAARLGGALRRFTTLALLFWGGSLGLSFPVMQMSWGGVLWSEPRLFMSAEIVFLLLVVWVVGLVSDNRRLLAFASLAAAAAMVALMATTSGAFHPDNPVFGSGSVRFIGSFILLVVGLLMSAAGLALTRWGASARARE